MQTGFIFLVGLFLRLRFTTRRFSVIQDVTRRVTGTLQGSHFPKQPTSYEIATSPTITTELICLSASSTLQTFSVLCISAFAVVTLQYTCTRIKYKVP
jgi:hypothetical protein